MNGNKILTAFIQGKLHEAEGMVIDNLNNLAALIYEGKKHLMASGLVSEGKPTDHYEKANKPVKVRGYKGLKKEEFEYVFEDVETFEEWADSEESAGHDVVEIDEDVEQIDEAGFSAPLSPLQKSKPDSGYMKHGKNHVFSSSNPDMRINRRAGLDKKIHWDDEAHKGQEQQKNQLNRIQRRLAAKKLAKEEQIEEGSAATRELLRKKIRAGFGKAEKSAREPIQRYPDAQYKHMEKKAMEKRKAA